MDNRSRPIVLSDSDRLELERSQRSPNALAGLTRRARAVLLMAEDVLGAEIARRLRYTPVQCSLLWRPPLEAYDSANRVATSPLGQVRYQLVQAKSLSISGVRRQN